MTKEEAKNLIIENQDKSLNELKRMIKKKMSIKQRTKFISIDRRNKSRKRETTGM